MIDAVRKKEKKPRQMWQRTPEGVGYFERMTREGLAQKVVSELRCEGGYNKSRGEVFQQQGGVSAEAWRWKQLAHLRKKRMEQAEGRWCMSRNLVAGGELGSPDLCQWHLTVLRAPPSGNTLFYRLLWSHFPVFLLLLWPLFILAFFAGFSSSIWFFSLYPLSLHILSALTYSHSFN